MSNFAYGISHHSDLIVQLVQSVNCQTYLELGIYDADTISRVSKVVPKVIGVDFLDLRKHQYQGEFHLMTTDDYLSQLTHDVDVCFIDACHQFESVKNNFKAVLEHLSDFGLIILHDTDPIEESLLDAGYCGDSYKMIEWLDIHYPELEVITLPVSEAGITIIKRHSDRRINKFLK